MTQYQKTEPESPVAERFSSRHLAEQQARIVDRFQRAILKGNLAPGFGNEAFEDVKCLTAAIDKYNSLVNGV